MPDGNIRPRRPAQADDVERLRDALEDLAEVRAPNEAEEPIFSQPIRRTIADWLIENSPKGRAALEEVECNPRSTTMLWGPPGTGKTSLAHLLAARIGVPMVLVGSENLISKYVGESSEKAGALFDILRKTKVKCLLFLDEIDALAGNRDRDQSKERSAALTTLMRKIETFSGYCVAATNRRQEIDPAMWRRFQIHLELGLPDTEERWAIIKRYSLPFDMADDDIHLLTDVTRNASGALLRGLMEGMKRSIALAGLLKRDISNPMTVFSTVVRSIDPPPGMDVPPLWKSEDAMECLAGLTAWPPPLKGPET